MRFALPSPRREFIFAFSVFIFLGLGSCSKATRDLTFTCDKANTPCLSGPAMVSLETSKGTVLLQLDGKNAPLTAGNYLDLVRKGVYDQTVFHRVIRSPLPFVVQGGDPTSSNPKTPVSSYGTGNYIDRSTGEARLIPLEFRLKGSSKFVYGQEMANAGGPQKPELTHARGAIAMARSSDPNTGSAQFYIALEALPELDGRYAVFGRVVRGMEVIDRIQQGDRLLRAKAVVQ
jgi:peptidyl-prolyl cis-trans isomerase B (cyclophilin B)